MTTPKIEMRRAELRRDAQGGRRLVGFAARYGVVADIGPFRERIERGAFAASIASGEDILAFFDHDPTKVLGRTKSQTLRLADEADGLAFEIAVPDTSAGRDALALAERGDLGGASIGFLVDEEAPSGDAAGAPVRVVKRARLLEISIVSAWPAYAETSVEARRGACRSASRSGESPFPADRAPRLDAMRRYLETVRG